METKKEDPTNSLEREGVIKNDLGWRSPWWGGRKEGTSNLKHSWSQFLVGFIHPVWWHPPDDGRLGMVVAEAVLNNINSLPRTWS